MPIHNDMSMTHKCVAVITTIQPPTEAVRLLCSSLADFGGSLIVIGDVKSPEEYDVPMAEYFSIARQLREPLCLAEMLPVGHYSRKNLGYLYAMSREAPCIYETDDDNAPLPSWTLRELRLEARIVENRDLSQELPHWVNIYRYFTDKLIWPRGLPLEWASKDVPSTANECIGLTAPIQQGLVDNSPDVDAVWRLLLGGTFSFEGGTSVHLKPGLWCPFNTQSTWWWPEAYPLLYVPSNCSFRMCDIWKSLVAQRCLWENGYGLVFHGPEVHQDRNPHDLYRDFEQEVPGYVGNNKIAGILEGISLRVGTGNCLDNLVMCYEALTKADFFPHSELDLVLAWANDCESVMQ